MLKIALTPGCPAGIGPELFPRALAAANLQSDTQFVWCASSGLFQKHAQAASLRFRAHGQEIKLQTQNREITIACLLADEDDDALNAKPAEVTSQALAFQRRAIDLAIDLAKSKLIQGIVTGPIRKAALSDGKTVLGQTEYLHRSLALDNQPALMCFAGADFLLALATIHIPLRDVASHINKPDLEAKLRRLQQAACTYFQIENNDVRLLALGLNPHAGEDGLIGNEEIETIKPILNKLNQEGFKISGPAPADGFFGHLAMGTSSILPHAVLAMYHDQGLAPYKLLCKGIAVNMTLGLTVVRTSPAHGTADNLAGTYTANPASLTRAIEIAEKMAIVEA